MRRIVWYVAAQSPFKDSRSAESRAWKVENSIGKLASGVLLLGSAALDASTCKILLGAA